MGVFADGASEGTFYRTVQEAVANATDGATVKLFTDISADDYVEIVNKNLVIDLNGYTWTSSIWAMYIGGNADITITDTSEEESGALVGASGSHSTISLYGNARLELAKGTISNDDGGYPVMISYGGNAVEADFVMSGGKVQGHSITAQGNSLTIKGGVLDVSSIYLMTGDLDISQYPDFLGVKISLWGSTSEIGTVSLPEGYAFMDEDGESEFVEYGRYSVKHVAHEGGTATCTEQAVCTVCEESYGELAAHEYDNACDGNCNVCEEDTRTPAAHEGGTATCTEQAVCTVCGESYGELAEHKYDNVCDGNCNVCEEDTRTPAAHVDEDKNGKCDVCTAEVPVEPDSSIESSTPETSEEESSTPETSDSETPDASSESTVPETSESTVPETSDSEEEDSGCSSMIDGISMAALALVGLAIFVKKRKEN